MKKLESATMMKSTSLPEDLVTALNLAQKPFDTNPTPHTQAVLNQVKQSVLTRVAQQRAALQTIRAGEGDWEIFIPGVRIKVLQTHGATQSYLLKLEPGTVVPPHRHPITEECVVLQGEIVVGDIRGYTGTYHRAPAHVAHTTISSPNGALLYLRGAVPDGKDAKIHPATLWAMVPLPVKKAVRQIFKR